MRTLLAVLSMLSLILSTACVAAAVYFADATYMAIALAVLLAAMAANGVAPYRARNY